MRSSKISCSEPARPPVVRAVSERVLLALWLGKAVTVAVKDPLIHPL